jgi:hypothetical protein
MRHLPGVSKSRGETCTQVLYGLHTEIKTQGCETLTALLFTLYNSVLCSDAFGDRVFNRSLLYGANLYEDVQSEPLY